MCIKCFKASCAFLALWAFVSALFCLPLHALDERPNLIAYMLPEDKKVMVDGNIDSVWGVAPFDEIAKVDKLLIPSETQTRGRLRALWDASALYLLIEVNKNGDKVISASVGGDHIYETDDSVEIEFSLTGNFDICPSDPNSKYCGTFLTDAAGNTCGSGWLYEHFSDGIEYAMNIVDDDEYVVEISVPWIFPADVEYYGEGGVGIGSRVALEIMINVLGESGREGLVTWSSDTPTGWLSTKNSGELELVGVPSGSFDDGQSNVHTDNNVWSPSTFDGALGLAVITGLMALSTAWMFVSRRDKYR